MSPNDEETLAAMEKYGGSFVKIIALAAKVADSDNFKRLKTAFPEYWEKYGEMARMSR